MLLEIFPKETYNPKSQQAKCISVVVGYSYMTFYIWDYQGDLNSDTTFWFFQASVTF